MPQRKDVPPNIFDIDPLCNAAITFHRVANGDIQAQISNFDSMVRIGYESLILYRNALNKAINLLKPLIRWQVYCHHNNESYFVFAETASKAKYKVIKKMREAGYDKRYCFTNFQCRKAKDQNGLPSDQT